MSVIQKIEGGYLQLLRVLLLILATVAIVGAVILAVRYLNDHDAHPKIVKEEIALTFDSYKPQAIVVNNSAEASKPGQPIAEPKDPLFDDFLAAINHLGKKAGPTFEANKEPAKTFFTSLENTPKLGRPYIHELIRMFGAAENNQTILSNLHANFGNEFNALNEHFQAEYIQKSDAIAERKVIAVSEAESARTEAVSSLYAAGVFFITFTGLILLVVLLKIERNLRGGVPVGQ